MESVRTEPENGGAAGGQFGVAGDAADDGGTLVVIGRCYRGRLALGDVFRRSFRYVPRRENGEIVTAGETDARPVDLTIRRIEAYRRDLDAIEEGLTARLTLANPAGVAVADGDVLET